MHRKKNIGKIATLPVKQFVIYFFAFLVSSSGCLAEEFTHQNLFFPFAGTIKELSNREIFPDVPRMNLCDAHTSYLTGDAIFVDIHPVTKADSIHILGSLHIDPSSPDIVNDLLQIGKDHPEKEIIVYDNGKTFLRSHVAVQAVVKAGMRNVFVYEGDKQLWAQIFPYGSILIGQTTTPSLIDDYDSCSYF